MNHRELFGVTYDLGDNQSPNDFEVKYLKSEGFEKENSAFWFVFDYTIAQIIAHVVEKKSIRILKQQVLEQKLEQFQNATDVGFLEFLPKARRAFGKNKIDQLFEIKTKLFNSQSMLLQHFCKWVATADALDDVYNALGSFKFGDKTILPIAGKVDLWAKFYLSVPNGQSVRNRYRLVARLFHQLGGGQALSIACGSAQPIIHAARELITNKKSADTFLVLTDLSDESLRIARKRTEDAAISDRVDLKKIPYQEIPALLNGRKFDIIEACGILDYLPDKHAIALIQIALQGLTNNGHLILSNMAPTRGAELLRRMYNWEIIYRTPEEFAMLIQTAGAKNIKVFVEPWGIHSVAIATK